MREGNQNRRLPFGMSAQNSLYAQYQGRAKRDGRPWTLTKGDFLWITRQSCGYCGVEPAQVYMPNAHSNGAYVYNGIDRVDNSRGYELDNCEACCYTCNVAKASMTRPQFIAWVRRVYEKVVA